jgi:hypothetical protein
MTLVESNSIVGNLASATKMPCQTYSLPARSCHVGSKLHDIPGSVCSKCYALRGNFSRPTVLNAMQKRLDSIKDPRWVEAMVTAIKDTEFSGFFRWHSSGDLQDLGHLIKICEVARRLPRIKFWLPTREIGILTAFKNAGFTFPSNLIVRFTATMIEQRPPDAIMDRLGVLGAAVSKVEWNCPAPDQENKCMTCRQCWDKRHKVVTYKYH